MKRRIALTLLLVPFVAVSIENVTAQKTTQADAKLEAEVVKVIRDYYDAWSRADEAAVISFNADDGFYYSERNGYENFEQAKQQFRSYFRMSEAARPRFTYQIDDIKITKAGLDSVIVNYKIVTKMTGGGMDREVNERYTNILAKRDGLWKLIAEHSSDIPKPVADVAAGMPVGWIRTPIGNAERYSMTVDTIVKHTGNSSASLAFACGDPTGFGSLAQSIEAGDYLGKRVRLSGWLRTENASEAGLWMRLDGFNRLLGFDNMMPRAVKGTTDWKQYEVVLDVPPETVNILFGALLSGTGRVWVDDLKIEPVGKDVPTTNQLSAEQMRGESPNRGLKKSTSKSPSNLGFEDGTRS